MGEQFKRVARVTHPPMRDYARKVGAEFYVISEPKHSTPIWDKLQLYDLFDRFDRIICIDSDTLVLPNCPNLFEIVPEGILGMYNEGLLTTDEEKKIQADAIEQAEKEHGIKVKDRGYRFYNAGVIVLSQCHKHIFATPDKQPQMSYADQPLYNLRILSTETPVQDIGYKFNRMPYVDSKVNEDRIKSYIIHYAGLANVDKLASFDLSRAIQPENEVKLLNNRLVLLDEVGISGKTCAEIGTHKGQFAAEIYRRNPGELWLIDPWVNQSANLYPDDLANVPQDEQDNHYYSVLSQFGSDPRVHIVRDFSFFAKDLVPDEYFDFVYVDAIHTFESCLCDIVSWFPKVKKGGWICGHDYNLPGVKTAVDSFLAITGKNLTLLCTEYWSSWGLQK
jgi:hypothetical protein